MAIKIIRLKNIIKKQINYPTFIGIFLSIILVAQYYISHEIHERKFISTQVRVIDGDTIMLGELRIRLQGIDSPELSQECRNKQSMQLYKCGEVAKEYLIKLIDSQEVVCTDEGIDKYRRQLAYCYVGDMNLNREMVKTGNALAYSMYDLFFTKEEIQARWNKAGIWGSEFEKPETFRKNKNLVK
jgi:endonuclease YncB( thermonuclease family)